MCLLSRHITVTVCDIVLSPRHGLFQALIYEKSLKIPCLSNDRSSGDDPPDPLSPPGK